MKIEYATAAAGAMCVIDWKSTCGSPIECSRRWSKRRGAWGAASIDPPSSASLRFSHEPGAPRLQWPPFPGGVPEGPKGTGCKPVGSAYGGSNPPAPTSRPWPRRLRAAEPPSSVARLEPEALSPGLFPAGLAGDAPHRTPAVLRPDDEQRSAAKRQI